jgi:hypothetical protein
VFWLHCGALPLILRLLLDTLLVGLSVFSRSPSLQGVENPLPTHHSVSKIPYRLIPSMTTIGLFSGLENLIIGDIADEADRAQI